jgi:hypothetical protein
MQLMKTVWWKNRLEIFQFLKLSLLAILLVKTSLVFELLVAVIREVVYYLESDRMLLG